MNIKDTQIEYCSTPTRGYNSTEFINLLLLAKSNDNLSKEKLINQHQGLISYHCKGIFLKSYTFDDLVQTATLSFLKAIENFDMDKGASAFSSYAFWCIKNNFSYLCRQENRHNQSTSLNISQQDGIEIIDLIPSLENLEDIAIKNITYDTLQYSLELLDCEELGLINFLYLNSSNKKRQLLSNYAKAKNKDYYYCTILKKRTLMKIKNIIQT